MKEPAPPLPVSPVSEEEIACPLCGSRDFSVYIPDLRDPARDLSVSPSKRYSSASFDRAHGRIVSCAGCGLVYIHPRPPAGVITGGYRDAVDPVYCLDGPAREATARQFMRLVAKFRKPGPLLDVGCAAGYFVSVAQRAHWPAQGVEPSRWLARLGRERFGVPIMDCTLREAHYPSGAFDAVTFWDTLEHMPDPCGELREAHRVLRDGGHLFISFPNVNCVFVKLLGRRHWWFTPGHLFYFGRRTISMMLEKTGFVPAHYRLHFPRFSLDYLVARLEPYSPRLHRVMHRLCAAAGVGKVMIPVYASQSVIVAVKKGE